MKSREAVDKSDVTKGSEWQAWDMFCCQSKGRVSEKKPLLSKPDRPGSEHHGAGILADVVKTSHLFLILSP